MFKHFLVSLGFVTFSSNVLAQEYCKFNVTGGLVQYHYLIPLSSNPNSINYESTLRNLITSAYFSRNKPTLRCDSQNGNKICTVTETGQTYDPRNYFQVFPNKQGQLVRVAYKNAVSIAPSLTGIDCSLANYSQPLYDSFVLSLMYQPDVPNSNQYLHAVVTREPIVIYPNARKSNF